MALWGCDSDNHPFAKSKHLNTKKHGRVAYFLKLPMVSKNCLLVTPDGYDVMNSLFDLRRGFPIIKQSHTTTKWTSQNWEPSPQSETSILKTQEIGSSGWTSAWFLTIWRSIYYGLYAGWAPGEQLDISRQFPVYVRQGLDRSSCQTLKRSTSNTHPRCSKAISCHRWRESVPIPIRLRWYCFERFEETELPSKESFRSTLNNDDISDDDYAHAKKVWERFEIDPGLAWEAMLKTLII